MEKSQENKGGEQKQPMPFGMAARVQLHKDFAETENRPLTEAAPEKAEAQTDGVQPKSETGPNAEKTGDEGADASESKEDTKKETPKKDDEAEKPKLVPLEALHEAREKLKARTLEARQKDTQLEELRRRLDSLEATRDTAVVTKDLPEGADKDPKYAALVTQINQLKARLEDDAATKAKNAAADAARQFEDKVNGADRELADEGYPGFQFTIEAVRRELKKQFDAGELTLQEVEDPKVWKAVYQETVFPQVKGAVQTHEDKARTEKKLDAKKKANLTTNPGTKPADETEDQEKPWDPDAYYAARQKRARAING